MSRARTSLLELDTSTLSAGDRLGAWSATIDAAFGPFGISRDGAERFHGRVRVERRQDIRFVELAYAGHGFRRSRADVSRLADAYYSLLRPLSGRLRLSQGGEERVLEPGRYYVVNHGAPYDTTPSAHYETFAVAFPPAALEARVVRPKPFYELEAGPCSARHGLLDSFVSHFAAGRDGWSDREFERLSAQLLDLVVLSIIAPGEAAAADESSARLAHRERALRHIRARLGDRALSPRSLAALCGVSTAYLHEVFRGTEAGVEETIFAERLERARALLASPGNAGVQIAAIAHRLGFCDAAQFSRMFRRRFGLSPREARAELR